MEYYVYPTVVSLPLGYDCTVQIPVGQIENRLVQKTGIEKVLVEVTAYRDGEIFFKDEFSLEFDDAKLVGSLPKPVTIEDQKSKGEKSPGFLEMAVVSLEEKPIFRTKAVFGLYSIYSKSGKKSFFSDNAYKYGSPPTIAQMAEFGQYVDAYPVIHIDKTRDLGETLVLINPYKRPILARVTTHDDRSLPRVKIAPESAVNVDMQALLQKGEQSWAGHVQLTANNRLIPFSIKHSFRDPSVISDHEHLDPYRSDPTFEPLTLTLRKWVGRKLRELRI